MSMNEKLDNEEFRIVSMDKESIKGDANKLKLLITSYAAIMEVQDAYMQEEINAKEEEAEKLKAQIASGKLTEAGVKSAKEDLVALTEQIESLKEVYEKFSESRTRFMDIAKKALRLPSANFEQLAEKGYTMFSGEKIELSSLASSYEEAEKTLTNEENKDVFSNINNEEIKKEIERVINEEVYTDDNTGKEKPVKEYIPNEVNTDKFDENALELANFVKENLDDNNDKKLAENGNDYFDKALAAVDTNDKDKENTKIETTTIEIPKLPVGTEGEWVKPEKPNTEDSIKFEDDKSIESFIRGLKDRNESLKAHGEELNSQLSDVKDERKNATEKREEAIKARDAAKRRAEEAQMQIELLNSYKPKMDELRKANEEQEKLNKDKEEELQKENEALAEINTETTALETETAAYDEKTSQSLEELKRLREEFAGTKYPGDDDGQYGGAGGRRK